MKSLKSKGAIEISDTESDILFTQSSIPFSANRNWLTAKMLSSAKSINPLVDHGYQARTTMAKTDQ